MKPKPKAPKHLDAAARRKWRELLHTLSDSSPGALDALAAYCQAYSRWTAAEDAIAAEGTIVDGRENPNLAIVRRQMVELHRWGRVLALHRRRRGRPKGSTAGEPQQDILQIMRGHPA